MSKKPNHIDEHFKNALDGFELPPDGKVWDDISQSISGEGVDEVFQKGLRDSSLQPSGKVWEGVRKELPLSLALKRGLNRLAIIAGLVVAGMMAIICMDQSKKDEIPAEEAPPTRIDVALDNTGKAPTPTKRPAEAEVATEQAASKSELKNTEGNTLDKSLDKKINPPAELNLHADDGLEVDEKRMREILAPVLDPHLDSALARINKANNELIEMEDGVFIPEHTGQLVPVKGGNGAAENAKEEIPAE